MNPATTIDDVIKGLDEVVSRAVDERSRIGFFAAMYQEVTLAVKQGIDAGTFDDSGRMSRFDAMFANRYFDAIEQLDTNSEPTRSWEAAFKAALENAPITVQHLFLGINAHINLDLGIATAEASAGSDLELLHPDFEKINDIMVGVLEDVKKRLAPFSPLIRASDDIGAGRPVDEILGFDIKKAREQAWDHAVVLSKLDEDAKQRMLDVLDHKTALLARIIRDAGSSLEPALVVTGLKDSDDVVAIIEAIRT